MPHVAFVPMTGFRIREEEMLALGMSMPGLKERAAAIGQLPALGLLTLAGMTPTHWTCSYHESAHAGESLIDQILCKSPDLVAVSALTASVLEAYRLSDALRGNGIRVVLGGLHATVFPEEAMRHCDAVVVGEGEPVWERLLRDVENGKPEQRYQARVPFDLARAPLPRFELLGRQPRPRFTVQSQRGCPLACEFCAASRLLGPHRDKPVANLRHELQAIAQLDPHPVIELADDNTFVGRPDAEDLLGTLAAANLRYFTEVDWRLGERGEVLRGLAASGCVQVLVGIESLVFRYPGMGPKADELAHILHSVQAIQDNGVAVVGCFIVGCDGETRASLDRLAEFILAAPFADVQLTLQTPFPGSALFRRLQRQGRLLRDRGWPYYTLFDVTFQPDVMDVVELETAFRELVRQVFAAEAVARRQRIRRQVWQKNPRLRSWASPPWPAS